MNFGDLVVALLLAVFIYWGWDSGVAVNEESEDPAEGPGKAAVVSTILLVLIYVVVTAAAQSFHGTGFLTNEANQEDVLNALGGGVLGSGLDKLLIIAVLTSASASTQTTILPTARTTLSMAHWKAVTTLLARVHKRYLTPTVSTLGFGLLSIIITVVLLLLSESVLEDSLTAIGFPICFYYGFTGVACGWYYRHDLMESARNFLLLGLGPLIGGLMLFGIGIKAAFYYGHAENVSSKPILGITLPLWMGIGGMILGGDRHARLAPVLQRVLLPQNRNRATGPARATAADRADTCARGLLIRVTPPITGTGRLEITVSAAADRLSPAPSPRAASQARPTAPGTAPAGTPPGRARRCPARLRRSTAPARRPG